MFNLPERPATADCWFLTGPTASGKTKAGLALAERLGAEIISLDSMTVYRGMDIGAAKPTAADRAAVPHHMLDIVEPTEEFSVSQFLEQALTVVEQIRQRGREPLFVGGTPLYLKTLLRGIDTGPPADWEFRRQVEQEAEAVGLDALHQRLAQVDPLAAAKLHPHDKRRVIRALEVHRATGRPISHMQVHFDEGRPAEECRVFVLHWPRFELHRRIEMRVEQMFEGGLLEEVEQLLIKHGAFGRTAAQAVGYREVIQYLQSDASPAPGFDAMREKIKARTRQFARRQETWFRRLSECRFVEMDESLTPHDVARKILALQQSATP